jgi:hypothetical protein
MPLNPPSSGGGGVSSGENAMLAGFGLLAESFQAMLIPNALGMTTQTLRASGIGLTAGQIVNNVCVFVSVTVSGTTPTLIRVGLCDQNYNLVASSANRAASGDFAVQGFVAVPLSAAYTVTTSGLYYAVYLQNGVFSVTNPTFYSGTTSTQAGKPITGTKRLWFEQSGLTDLPNPAVPANPLNAPVWFGLT